MNKTVLPALETNLPSWMKPVKMTKYRLGKLPERCFGPVRTVEGSSQDNPIEIDVGINLDVNAEIEITFANTIKVGISNISLGPSTLCSVFRPISKKLPLVSGVQVFFFCDPLFDFKMTGVGAAAEWLTKISETVHQVVREAARIMVLPHAIYLPWGEIQDRGWWP